jgi:hypothetical protein
MIKEIFQKGDNVSYSGINELYLNESFLPQYNANIVNILLKKIKLGANYLEFGAGIGTLSILFDEKCTFKPDCLEIDPNLRCILSERGFNCIESLSKLSKKYDVIFSSNVLEHIEDDETTLVELKEKLIDGGSLFLYLPAFQCLYSTFDLKLGHFRRYSKKDIVSKLIRAGYHVQECFYSDSIGFFAWLYLKIKKNSGMANSKDGVSLRLYDKYIFPLSRALDYLGVRYIFGKNLVVVAKAAKDLV